MFYQPLDHLAVPLAERSHQAGHLSVVLAVDIGAGAVQQLHNVQMAAVGSQPEGGVALLVAHVHLGPAREQQLDKPDKNSINSQKHLYELYVEISSLLNRQFPTITGKLHLFLTRLLLHKDLDR